MKRQADLVRVMSPYGFADFSSWRRYLRDPSLIPKGANDDPSPPPAPRKRKKFQRNQGNPNYFRLGLVLATILSASLHSPIGAIADTETVSTDTTDKTEAKDTPNKPAPKKPAQDSATQDSATQDSAAKDSPWRLPRANPGNTASIEPSLPKTLKVDWEYEAGEAISSSPVVFKGTVVVADEMGTVHAIDLANGTSKWKKTYDTGFNASPAIFPASDQVDRDLIVLGDVYGFVYALDLKTGEEAWKFETLGQVDSAVGFFKSMVLVTSQDGVLHALNIRDGKPVWNYPTDDQLRCSPTVVSGQTFLGGCDAKLHRVDLSNGKPMDVPVPLAGPTGSTPSAAGNQMLIAPIMSGVIYGIDLTNGSIKWEYESREDEYRTDPAVKGDFAVVVGSAKNVDAISIADGKRKWRYSLRRRASASPVIAGDDVWIASTDGRLIRLGLADGKEKWVYEIRGQFDGPPAVTPDHLIIGDDKGVVRCFGADRQ